MQIGIEIAMDLSLSPQRHTHSLSSIINFGPYQGSMDPTVIKIQYPCLPHLERDKEEPVQKSTTLTTILLSIYRPINNKIVNNKGDGNKKKKEKKNSVMFILLLILSFHRHQLRLCFFIPLLYIVTPNFDSPLSMNAALYEPYTLKPLG